jgi:hypothetical protein
MSPRWVVIHADDVAPRINPASDGHGRTGYIDRHKFAVSVVKTVGPAARSILTDDNARGIHVPRLGERRTWSIEEREGVTRKDVTARRCGSWKSETGDYPTARYDPLCMADEPVGAVTVGSANTVTLLPR